MEVQITNGIAKINRIKLLLKYRWYFSLAGQALICILIVKSYSGKDLLIILLCSFFFLTLMLQGFTTAILQSYQAFKSYLKTFWYVYPIAGVTGLLGWIFRSPMLLILPDVFLTLTSIIYVRRISNNQNNANSISFNNYFTISKHYAVNAFLSTFYTRIDTVIIFIFSMQAIAADYLYVQRIMSAPLFLVSFMASVYLTKVALNKEYLYNGLYLFAGSMVVLITYSLVIINITTNNLITYAIIFLTVIKVTNAYLTAALVALGRIRIISNISTILVFISILLVFGGGVYEGVVYLPIALIFLESLAFIFSLHGLRKNAQFHTI
jgi:hypothetical protein